MRKKQQNQHIDELISTLAEQQQENPLQRYERLQQQQQQHRRQEQARGQVGHQRQQQPQQQHRRQEQVRGQVEHRRQQPHQQQQQQQQQQQHRRQQPHRPQPFELNAQTLRNGSASLSIEMEKTDHPPTYSRCVSVIGDPPINFKEKECPPSYYDEFELQNIVTDKVANFDKNQNAGRRSKARWLHAKKLIISRLHAGKFIEILQEKSSISN